MKVFNEPGATYRFVPLKEYHASSLIAGCKIIACMIKLDGGYDIGCLHKLVSRSVQA